MQRASGPLSPPIGSSMPDAQHFIVATAGHVDHGKSALIKALTGTDPDRLPEEKARGITIDLGFAHLELPVARLQPSSFLLGIVDVPGHEDFVKNMVAGVGSDRSRAAGRRGRRRVDAADRGASADPHLLRRAPGGGGADESRSGDGRSRRGRARSASGWRDSPFADAPIVPTSVVERDRASTDLKATLARVLADDASAARHRQAAAAGRPRVHAAGHRDRRHRHALRRHAAPRPVGRDSAVRHDRRAFAGSSRTAATWKRAGRAPGPR